MLKVIGSGFGRTGTHSLAAALQTLGFGPCYHMLELARNPEHNSVWSAAIEGRKVNWGTFFQSYKSSVEWPAVSFLSQILPAFPQAKVILTHRSPHDWFQSANATIFDGLELSAYNPDPGKQEQGALASRLILEGVFSGRYREKDFAVAVYQQHIKRVTALIPAERLLHYRISEGWGPLCSFLQVPEPQESFPRKNTRAEFLSQKPEWAARLKRQRSSRVGKPAAE